MTDVGDCSQSNGRVADQRLANVDSLWYGQRWSRFLRSSSLSRGASGRGGVLESELIGDTIGKLNIIYVVTTDDNLIPWVRAFPRVPSCAGDAAVKTDVEKDIM